MSENTNKLATSGERLKALRLRAGLNQARLAIQAGTTAMHIMDLENGSDDFEDKLQSIAQALGCNAKWLRTGQGRAMATGDASEVQPKPATNVEQQPSAVPESSQNKGVSETIVTLGSLLEGFSPPARQKFTSIVQKLAEDPDKKWDLAMQAGNLVETDMAS